MATDDKIRYERLQYNINREAAKVSALSSRKIDKYQYPTHDKILPSDQSRVIEQAKFTYHFLVKGSKNKQKQFKARGKTN